MTKAYSYLRISSKEQIRGGGIERQLESTRRYAAENGLVLDDELRDIGKSGYHSAHVKDGALGLFLELVKTGKIDRGSVLIVESLDRLSRADVITAQSQLLQLLSADIDVVTLMDNQRYTRESDFTQLIISLTIMSRAHEESRTKAERTKAARARSKQMAIDAGGGVYVHNAPYWIDQIKQNDGTYRFKLNDKANVVRQIFNYYDNGLGATAICRMLNQNGIKTFKRNAVWSEPVIFKILRNETAIGSLTIGSKVLPGYFPACVDEVVYWRVQDLHKQRSESSPRKGRKGERFTNLYQGFVCCHHCGGPIATKRKGVGSHLQYYQCNTQFLNGDCRRDTKRKLMRLELIEKAILDNVLVYHLDNALSTNTGNVEKERSALVDDVTKFEKQISNSLVMAEMAENPEDIAVIMGRVNGLRQSVRSSKARIDELDRLMRETDADVNDRQAINQSIQDEIAKWPSLDKEALYISRSKVSHSLRKLVTAIRLDFDNQTAIVAVGGFIRFWVIQVDGTVKTDGDWSMLPFDILVHRAKEFFGDKIDITSMKSVYDRIDIERPPVALWDSERAAKGIAQNP
ncbi:hypothetical protein A6U96_14070 [Agrobacterium tumefaciens]|nr:hypothetical protein A6U96_14070 [Agrobacterium tumefaciens]